METLVIAYIVLAVCSIALARIVAGVVEHRRVREAMQVLKDAMAKQTTVSVSLDHVVAVKALNALTASDKTLSLRVSVLASAPILLTDFAGARVAVWTH